MPTPLSEPPVILAPAAGDVWNGTRTISWSGTLSDSAEGDWHIYCDADCATPYDYYLGSVSYSSQNNPWNFEWDTTGVLDSFWHIVIYESGPFGTYPPGFSGQFELFNNNTPPGTIHNIEKDTYHSSINDAIILADAGNTIFVPSGTYRENVDVYRQVKLLGEDRDTTVIDGRLLGPSILISAAGTKVSGFTISNASNQGLLMKAGSCEIFDNIMVNNNMGVGYTSTSAQNIHDNIIYGGLTNSKSNNCIVERNEILLNTGNFNIFYLHFSEGCMIRDNHFSNVGIYLQGNTLTHWNTHTIDATNLVNGKPIYYLKNQNGGTIPPDAGGVILANSHYINVKNQVFSNTSAVLGIGFSNNNIIANNTISFNRRAIFAYDIDYNTFTNNSLVNNAYGIEMIFSQGNRFYHNNFINSPVQDRYDYLSTISKNFWNASYPVCGNYWSNYAGDDIYSGPGQNIPGQDGVGDMPHLFNYGQDNYPLMEPWNSPKSLTFTINLSEGWNLISVPLEMAYTPIEIVLSSISGSWNVVKLYDGAAKSWKTYRVGGAANSLWNIDCSKGIWLHATENCTLELPGEEPTSTTIVLHAGWNLVGYPSMNERSVGDALWGTGADRVEVFDSVSPYIKEVGPTYLMKPGEGYWVRVQTDTVWVVDW